MHRRVKQKIINKGLKMESPKKASELSEKTTVSQDVEKTDETQTETAVNAGAENQTSIIQDNTNANKNEPAK